MVEFVGQNLQDPDVRAAARPMEGVVDRAGAMGIGVLGSALEMGVEAKGKVDEIRDENTLREVTQDFRTESDVFLGKLSPEEVKRVDKVGEEVSGLKGANASGLTESQFRTRTEALLKQHIASSPHLANEIRAKAAQVLGFDPTGSEIDAKFASLRQEAQNQAAADKDLLRREVALGLNILNRGTPEYAKTRARMFEMAEQASLLDLSAKITPDTAGSYSAGQYVNTRNTIGQVSVAAFGKNILELNASDIAALPEAKRREFDVSLENLRSAITADYISRFPNSTASQAKLHMQGSMSYVDMVKGYLNGTTQEADLKAWDSVHSLSVRSDLLQSPAFSAMDIMAKQGVVPTGKLLLEGQGVVLDYVQGKGISTPTTPEQRQGNEAALKMTKDLISTLKGGFGDAPVEIQGAIMGVVDSLERSKDINVTHSILSVFADKKAGAMLTSLDADHPIIDKLINNSITYASDSSRALSKELEFEASQAIVPTTTFAPRRKALDLVKDRINFEVRDGLLLVSPKDINVPRDVSLVTNLRNKYAVRINTAVKALANGSGMSTKEAFETMKTKHPGSFSWLVGEEGEGPETNPATPRRLRYNPETGELEGGE